jgi:hypothetical protein
MNDEALDNLRHLLGSPWFGASEVGEVIDRLARADVMATLVALCGGTVDRERLFALAPRAAFEKIVSYLELSMNTHAAGSELVVISSPATPVEDARKRFEACRTLVDALIAHGVVHVDVHPDHEDGAFTLRLLDAQQPPPPAPDPRFAAALDRGGPRYPVCVRFAGAGQALSGARDGTMTLWDLDTGHVVRTFHGHAETVWSIACTGDGTRAVTASGDTTMRLWDLATGRCLRVFEGHTDPLRTVELAPDGRRALTGGWDGSMRIWDVDTGQCLHRYECHSGSRFSNEVPATLVAGRALSHAPYSRHALWDLSSGACTTMIEFDPYPRIAALAEDGRAALCHHIVAAGGKRASQLVMWDLDALAAATTFAPFPGQGNAYSATPRCLAISPCGRWVAAGYESGGLHVWDRASGRHVRALGHPERRVNGIVFSRDGRTLLSASNDLAVRLWDVAGGECLRTMKDERARRADSAGDIARPLLPSVSGADVPASVLGYETDRVPVTLKAPAPALP